MTAVNLCQLPATLQQKIVNDGTDAAFDVVAAADGKVVKLWGAIANGGPPSNNVSFVVSSDSTNVSGIIRHNGIQMFPLPSGNRADSAYPYFESAAGKTLTITPNGAGMNAVFYYTQD